MYLAINTAKFQEMLVKAVKGAGNNKMIPVTSLLAIKLENERLSLITTDGNNVLHIIEDGIKGDYFYVVVEADTISKLIARMTCETVTLEVTDNYLQVKGNGTYNIDIPLNESGEPIKFPEGKLNKKGKATPYEVSRSDVQLILNAIKPSVAVTLEEPCYTGYYIGDSVIGTDSNRIAAYDKKLFDKDALVSPEMMELWAVMTDDKFTVTVIDNYVVCKSSNCEIYGLLLRGIEDYSIDAINTLIEVDMPNTITLSKNEVLQALDRIALFVGVYDKNIVKLEFADNAVTISSKATNGVETIHAVGDERIESEDFTCYVDITMLQSQVKAVADSVFELEYGADNAIKLQDAASDVTQILALCVAD